MGPFLSHPARSFRPSLGADSSALGFGFQQHQRLYPGSGHNHGFASRTRAAGDCHLTAFHSKSPCEVFDQTGIGLAVNRRRGKTQLDAIAVQTDDLGSPSARLGMHLYGDPAAVA